MLSNTRTLSPWWNFSSERKVRQNMMYGGIRSWIRGASLHKVYFKKRKTAPQFWRKFGHQNAWPKVVHGTAESVRLSLEHTFVRAVR